MNLEDRYRRDPILRDFYSRRLLKTGWAGTRDDIERAYAAASRREQGKALRGKPFSQNARPVPVAAQSGAERILEDQRQPITK